MEPTSKFSRRNFLQSSVLATVALAGCTKQLPSDQNSNENSDELGTFAEDDPSRHSYPSNPSSREEEILGSNYIEDTLWERYNTYRTNHEEETLYPNATLNSVSRQHSYRMGTNNFLEAEPKSGETPLSQYDSLRVDGTKIHRIVRKTTVTAIDEAGERTDINEKKVADTLFSKVLSNESDAQELLTPKKDASAAGVGVFLSPTETDTKVTVDVYLTIDICYGFDVLRNSE